MKPIQIILPVVVLGAGIGISQLIIASKPEASRKTPEPVIPTVETRIAEPESVTLSVTAQGTVRARTQSTLAAELAGRIQSVAPNFRSGGFFEAGELLVEIDDADYLAALRQAEASYAQADLALSQEEAQARQAREDWARLGSGEATPLTLREPQLQKARADLASAKAAIERARRDLDRTRVRAPYQGRVIEQNVDIGQYATPGMALARIHATDVAEIRLPISLREAAKLDLPMAYDNSQRQPSPEVTLHFTFGKESHEWAGRIVRTEAAIDQQTRFLTVVAEVDAPYSYSEAHPQRPPLKLGLFVTAEISGKTLHDVYRIPRYAIHGDNEIWVSPEGKQLERREVPIIAQDADYAYLRRGIAAGEQIILTPLEFVTQGMPIKVAEADPSEVADAQPAEPTAAQPDVTGDAL